MAIESSFQTKLESELQFLYPDAIIMKNDPNVVQGIPDLTVLLYGKWAFLECKRNEGAAWQVNQSYYVGYANKFAFGAFIYPENKREVLSALDQYFKS